MGGGGGSVITGKGGGLRFFPFKDELTGDIVGVAVGTGNKKKNQMISIG